MNFVPFEELKQAALEKANAATTKEELLSAMRTLEVQETAPAKTTADTAPTNSASDDAPAAGLSTVELTRARQRQDRPTRNVDRRHANKQSPPQAKYRPSIKTMYKNTHQNAF